MPFKKGRRAPQTFEQCLNWYESVTIANTIRNMVNPLSDYMKNMDPKKRKQIILKCLKKRYGIGEMNKCRICKIDFFSELKFRRHMLFWHTKYIT